MFITLKKELDSLGFKVFMVWAVYAAVTDGEGVVL
jgi:hypothetical protein